MLQTVSLAVETLDLDNEKRRTEHVTAPRENKTLSTCSTRDNNADCLILFQSRKWNLIQFEYVSDESLLCFKQRITSCTDQVTSSVQEGAHVVMNWEQKIQKIIIVNASTEEERK